MKPLPSQLVIGEEGKYDPSGGIDGEGALLDYEICNDKQRNREEDGKERHSTGTKHGPAQPFRS